MTVIADVDLVCFLALSHKESLLFSSFSSHSFVIHVVDCQNIITELLRDLVPFLAVLTIRLSRTKISNGTLLNIYNTNASINDEFSEIYHLQKEDKHG